MYNSKDFYKLGQEQKNKFVINPEYLDIPKSLSHIEDRARIAINIIIHRQFTCEKGKNKFVNLQMKLLRKQLGRWHADDIMDELRHAGIIERDYYLEKVKPYGYRLTPEYAQQKLVHVQIANRSAIRTYNSNLRKFRENPRTETHCHLLNSLYLLKIDFDNAYHYVCQYEQDERQIERTLHFCACIAERDWQFTSDQYGRVHTNYTNLPKCVRQFLTIQGKKLHGTDTANTQPLLYNLEITKHKQEINNIDKRDRQGRAGHTPIMMDIFNPYKSIPLWNRDADILYKHLTETGTFYAYLAPHVKNIKKKIIKLFYASTSDAKLWYPDLYKTWESHFPYPARLMYELKKDNHKSFSHEMQRAESDLYITKVCTRLMNEHPHVPFLTLHDCYDTNDEANLDIIEQILKEEYAKIGLASTQKRKHY